MEYKNTIKLFEDYRSLLLNVCLKITKNKELAEEVVQDTAIRVLKSSVTPANYRSWIVTIARNIAKNKVVFDRREGRERNMLSIEGVFEPRLDSSQLESTLYNERLSWVEDKIMELPEKQCQVAILRGFDGYEYDEIAKDLGCSAGTVRVQYNIAISKLKNSIKEIE